MPEPSTAAVVASYTAASLTLPALTAFGIPLGLRPEVLAAGFGGALAALGLLNSVPATGDTWRHLIKDTGKRIMFAVLSSLTAGYLAPVCFAMLPSQVQAYEGVFLGIAFAVGVGAQRGLLGILARAGNNVHDSKEGSK